MIARVIVEPRADVYTRPGMHEMPVRYYGAEDMAAAEAAFHVTPPAPPR